MLTTSSCFERVWSAASLVMLRGWPALSGDFPSPLVVALRADESTRAQVPSPSPKLRAVSFAWIPLVPRGGTRGENSLQARRAAGSEETGQPARVRSVLSAQYSTIPRANAL